MITAMERWVFVRDGKLYFHEENDGWTYMRHGPEASERETTLEALAEERSWQSVARWLFDALREQERTQKFLAR